MKLIACIIMFLSASTSAFAKPEVFQLPVNVKLTKLTADLQHPGGVMGQTADGSGKQVVSIPLTKCETFGGAEQCSGSWQKTLSIDEGHYFFFVNVYNQTGSDNHSIVLLVCSQAVQRVEECKKWISNQIDFKGVAAPHVSLYDSGQPNYDPASPATYQPHLEIGG